MQLDSGTWKMEHQNAPQLRNHLEVRLFEGIYIYIYIYIYKIYSTFPNQFQLFLPTNKDSFQVTYPTLNQLQVESILSVQKQASFLSGIFPIELFCRSFLKTMWNSYWKLKLTLNLVMWRQFHIKYQPKSRMSSFIGNH